MHRNQGTFFIGISTGKRNDFDKKQFIKQLFEKLAKHFQLSVRMFIREIQQNRKCLKSIPKEIDTIVTESMQPAENSAGKITAIQDESIHINNGGVVLLSPWLPRLYSLLGLTESNIFRNGEAQIKAVYLIQYAVFGHTHFPEYELILNKILVGLPTDIPVPAFWDLTEQEKQTIRSMLEGVRQNWPGLKNSSVAALQETFLQREGKLEIKYDHYRLTMEEKTFDLLLDDISWNFRMIKQTWMKKRIEVKWR